jgi:hypothetical protein
MRKVDELINELSECREVTIMSLEEFLDILTKEFEASETQLSLDLDTDEYN